MEKTGSKIETRSQMENYGSTLEKGVNMKGKGSVLEARSQHGRQRVNTEYKKSKWKILSQH